MVKEKSGKKTKLTDKKSKLSSKKKYAFSAFFLNRIFPLDRSAADKAIEQVEQKTRPWRIFFLFFGFMLCVTFATYGSVILRYRISFWQAIAITGAAAALIFALVALFALTGNRLGVTTSHFSQHAFGTHGAKVISGFLALANLVLAAYFLTDILYKTDEAALLSSVRTTYDFPFFLYLFICVIVCVLAGFMAFFGGHIIMKASIFISAFFIIVIITAIFNAKRYFNFDYVLDVKPGSPFEMILALFLLFASIAFVVLPVASDFGRLIRTRNAVEEMPTSKSCQRSKLIQSVFFGGFLGLLGTIGIAILLGISYTEFKQFYSSKPLIASLTWSDSENRVIFWIAILLVYLLIVSIFLYSASLAFGFLFPKVKKKWFALIAALILLVYCTVTIILIRNAAFHIFAILPVFTILIAALMGILFAKIISFARDCAKARHDRVRRAMKECEAQNKWNLHAFVVFALSAVLGLGFSQPIYTYESPVALWLGFISQPLGVLVTTWYSPSYAHILAFLLAFLLIFFEGSFKFLFRYIIIKNKKVGV